MHYQNDTFLFLLQEVSLKYHKSSMKYHKNSLLTIFHDIAQKPSQTLGNRCPTHGLSMPITWALSAHLMGIDRPTNEHRQTN